MPRVSSLVRTAEFLHAAGERPFGHFDHDAKNMQGPAERPSAPPEPSANSAARYEFTLDESGDVVGIARVDPEADLLADLDDAFSAPALENELVLGRDA